MERMYGVTFGDKHSYDDWGIYWNGYSEGSPEPQRLLFEVPYKNGLLDATQALTDKIFYKSRTVSFDFIVHENNKTWPEVRSMVNSDVHGKHLHVTMDTDSDYYWDAYKCTVGNYSNEEEFMKFNIECECFPYKLKKDITTRSVEVTGQGITLTCPNSDMQVNPTFVTDQDVQVVFTDYKGTIVTIAMNAGSHTLDNIEFWKGDNVLTFNKMSNNASVTVSYREGSL